MKRDMELIRNILLVLEEWPINMGDAISMTPELMQSKISGHDDAALNHHMDLIYSSGFIDDGGSRASGPMFGFIFMGLTMAGHDFLDSIRDPQIWQETKDVSKQAGGFTMDLLKALAKGLIKKKIEQHTGVDLDF